MNEDDDILRASSPSPRSPVEETLANMSSRTIFDEPYDPSSRLPRSPVEKTLQNMSRRTIFDEPYDPSPYMPIDIDKARETWDAWGTEKAAFWTGIQHTAPFNLGRIVESWVGDKIPFRLDFGDLPWTEEVEEGMNLNYTHDWLGISESEWDKLSIGERSKLIDKTVTERIKDKYKPNELSAIYTVIKTGSLFLDPTFFMPIAGAASKIGVVKASAAVAVTDSALYEYSTKGEITAPQTALALTLGAGGGKLYKTLHQKAKVKKARENYNTLVAEVHKRYAESRGNKSSMTIWMDILKDFNITEEGFAVMMKTARTGKIPKGSSDAPAPSFDVHPAYMSTDEAIKHGLEVPPLADIGRSTGGTVRGLGNVTATNLKKKIARLEEFGGRTSEGKWKNPSKVQGAYLDAEKAAQTAQKIRDMKSGVSSPKGPLGRFVNEIIEPLSGGLARYNPILLRLLQKLEGNEMRYAQRDFEEVAPFLKQMLPYQLVGKRVLSKEHVDELHYMMAKASDGDIDSRRMAPRAAIVEIEKFIRGNAKSVEKGEAMVKNYQSYREVMDRIYRLRNTARREARNKGNELVEELGHLGAYTPIKVKDLGRVEDSFKLDTMKNAEYQKMLEARAKQLDTNPDNLKPSDRIEVLERLRAKEYNPAAGSSKHRTHLDLTRKELKEDYMDIGAATTKYIKESHQEIHRYNLFGKYLDEDNMAGTIDNFVGAKMRSNQTHLIELLKHRYLWGPRSTHTALQAIKNTGYLTLLAHPVNAARQLGDLALGAYENGLINSVKGLYDSILRRGMSPREEGMVTNMAHELTEATWGRKTLDWGMKWSGFSYVDALGKGALMNGTIRRISKDVKSIKGVEAIRTKWGAAFGEDTSKLIDDFRKFNRGEKFYNKYTGETDDFSPLMKELAFAQVSKFQPISMLEMPKMWLKAPNGRFLYMLQSFTLKQVNVWRQDVFKELFTKGGNKVKGTQAALRLASFFTLGNMGVDKINDLILGKDRDLEQLFILNLYRNIGLINKYDMDRFSSGGYGIGAGGVVGNVMATFGPPLDPLADGVSTLMGIAMNKAAGRHWAEEQKWDKLANAVPIIGKIVGAWGYKAGLPPTKKHDLPTKQQYDKAHSYLPKIVHGGLEDIYNVKNNIWNKLRY